MDIELWNKNVELKKLLDASYEKLKEAQGRIRELEAQIQVMRCCGNCNFRFAGCSDKQAVDCYENNLCHWQPKEVGK